MGEVIVLNSNDNRCCAEEGERNETWKPCCNNMPTDYLRLNSGICGCPTVGGTKYVWDPVSRECEFPRQSCFGQLEVQCQVDIRTNFVAWLGDPNCFRNFLSIPGGDTPYEAACCPYIVGEGYNDIYDFEIPDSMITVS